MSGDFPVVAFAHRFLADLGGDVLLDEGTVQSPVAQKRHAALERIIVGQSAGLGGGGKKPDLNDGGKAPPHGRFSGGS